MADKPQNTTNGVVGTFSKNMDTDNQGIYGNQAEWSYARNAVTFTQKGDLGDISNEKSNLLMASAPYPIIGGIHIKDGEWCIFSTSRRYHEDPDENNGCEIGLFDEKTSSYEPLINNVEGKCLNFDLEHLVKGVARIDAKCHRKVYWDDGINPSRCLDIDDIPWIKEDVNPSVECIDLQPQYDSNGNRTLDCDKIRLAPIFNDLSFKCTINDGAGELPNGSYFVFGAYLVDGQRVSGYSIPSNTVSIFNHQGLGGSITVEVTETDTEFEYFELNIFQYVDMNSVANRVGVYSTSQKRIVIDSVPRTSEVVDWKRIVINNEIPLHTDAMVRFDDYLMRLSPTYKFKFNYQPQANKIKAHWVCIKQPMDYYKNGGSDVGYMRDEVYSFFIRFVYNTGDRSDSYHIPGRLPDSEDLAQCNSDNIYHENDKPKWRIYNTAKIERDLDITGKYLDKFGNPTSNVNLGYGQVDSYGEMSYWESSERYPDNYEERWGDLCGKPIRHHKFPANVLNEGATNVNQISTATNHYTDNGKYIRVMGVFFTDIEYPMMFGGINSMADEDKPVDGIVGYEILRGSRTGNKTVIAKGMLNNMRQYWIPGESQSVVNATNHDQEEQPAKRYYPNYPYNPVSEEEFLSKKITHNLPFVQQSWLGTELSVNEDVYRDLADFEPLGAEDLTNVSRDVFTFHSPDTSFRHPFLSAKELKINGEAYGKMSGFFRTPEGHPRHRLITDRAFTIAMIMSFGHAIEKLEGKVIEINESSGINYGGTTAGGGVAVSTTGLFGLSAPASFVQIVAHLGKAIFNKTIGSLMDNPLGFNMIGLSSEKVKSSMSSIVEGASAAAGQEQGKDKKQVELSAWQRMPFPMRLLTGLSSFLTYWGEGIDQILNVMYSFTSYRQYALQQISHGYYDKFSPVTNNYVRRLIDDSGYVTQNLCSIGGDTIVNNMDRSTTVGLKITEELGNTRNSDNSMCILSDNHLWGSNTGLALGNRDPFVMLRDFGQTPSFSRDIASYYVSLKQRLDNQYGQIDNIIQLPISTDWRPIKNDDTSITSPVLFGGDTYIGRYAENNTMPFFRDWLDGQPDGTVFNYKNYANIPYPRFWMDTDPYDVSELMNNAGGNGTEQSYDIFKCVDEGEERQNINGSNENAASCMCGFHFPEFGAPQEDGSPLDPFMLNRACEINQSAHNEYLNADENDCYYNVKCPNLFKRYKRNYLSSNRLDLIITFLESCAEYAAAQDSTPAQPWQIFEQRNNVDGGENTEGTAKSNPFYPADWDDEGLWPFAGLLYATVHEPYAIVENRSESDDEPVKYIKKITLRDSNGQFGNMWFDLCYNDGHGCNPGPDPDTFFGKHIWCDEMPKSIWYRNRPKNWLGTKSKAEDYLQEEKGPYARIIRRLKRKIENLQKKMNKDLEKMRKKTGQDNGSGNGFFCNLSFPSSKYVLDYRRDQNLQNVALDTFGLDVDRSSFRTSVKDAYMYLFVSGVRDFFVESEVNIDLRDWGDGEGQRFYDHTRYTDLNTIFKPKFIRNGNVYRYDWSLSAYTNPFNFISFGAIQKRDYDICTYLHCLTKIPQRLLYSQRQVSESLVDNWRVFLPLNYHDFTSRVVNLKDLGRTTMMTFLENDGPVLAQNTSTLQTSSDLTITVGDGSMFNQKPQSITTADLVHERGACQNFYSVIYTPAGLFWVGQNQNKIYTSTDNVTPITNGFMKSWFDNYTKFKLTQQVPEFNLTDNPVAGIGFQSVFDNETNLVYFCKRDYELNDETLDKYNKGQFEYVDGSRFVDHSTGVDIDVYLGDKRYFNDASWTISYSPMSQQFVSFHDWHPRLTFGSRDTFMTTEGVIKDKDLMSEEELIKYSDMLDKKWNAIWKHNERYDSFCNFYGKDFPFEVEVPLLADKAGVNTVRDVRYYMEVYVYGKNGYDRMHVLDFNFDEAIVYNSEQCSGLLKLNLKRKNDPRCLVSFPKVDLDKIEILFSKEEQVYRFDQFYDIVNDRGEFIGYTDGDLKQGDEAAGEFDNIAKPIFNYEPNGYVRNINADAIDYAKSQFEHKRFRHYKNYVLLRRTVSGDRNMILSLAQSVNLASSR